jgi:hypothetical protein
LRFFFAAPRLCVKPLGRKRKSHAKKRWRKEALAQKSVGAKMRKAKLELLPLRRFT